MKTSKNTILFLAIIVIVCNGQTNKKDFNNKQDGKVKYAELTIDREFEGEKVPGDWDPYFGPAAIDLDSAGNIYLLNMNNTIQKYNKDGRRIWNTTHNTQQLDIKIHNGELFSFDGKKVYIHDIDSGKIADTIPITIEKKDYTPIGNVSRFYSKHLFINKWFIQSKKELVYVFNLDNKLVSPRAPEGIELYPISKCPACSLSFVKILFESREEVFVNESNKYIAYYNSGKEFVGIFNKMNGKKQYFYKLPELLSTMSIRFVSFLNDNEFICCTVKMKDFEPKSLVFYRYLIKI